VRVCTYKPNLIYDVGMNNGDDTAYYLHKGYDVIGFEADPKLIGYCTDRFTDEIDAGRLIIIPGAISCEIPDGRGKVPFYINPHHVWNSCDEGWATRWGSTHTIRVPKIDFLDCLKTYGIPYYMKIDIEGMDWMCLKSLQDEWITYVPQFISVELYHSAFGYYMDLLTSLGYHSFNFVQQFKHADDGNWSFNRGSSGRFGRNMEYEDMNIVRTRYCTDIRPRWLKWKGVNDSKVGRPIRMALERLLNKPLPGWYDLHGVSNVRKG